MNNKIAKRRFAAIMTGYSLLVLIAWFCYNNVVFSHTQQIARVLTSLAGNNLLTRLDSEFSRIRLTSSVIAGSAYVRDFLEEKDVASYYEKAKPAAEIIRKTAYPQMYADSIITITEGGAFYRFTGSVSNEVIANIHSEIKNSSYAPIYSIQEIDGTKYFCHITYVYAHELGQSNPVGSVVILSNLSKMRRMLSEPREVPGIDTAVIFNDKILLSGNIELEGKESAQLNENYGAVTVSQVTGTSLFVAAAVTKETLYKDEQLSFLVLVLMLSALLLLIAGLYRLLSRRMITPMLDKADKMQMGLLGTQISAHFVVNTIVCIEKLSQQGQNEKATAAAANLAEMLRHMHESDEEINVFSELEQLSRYIEIMNIRAGGKFEVEVDVDDVLSDYKMPGHVLQPLVENALTHGLGNKATDCRLTVTGRAYKSHILFEIKDNGVGILSDALEGLNLRLKDTVNHDYPEKGLDGVALVNVQKRIQARYGNGYGVSIDSTPGTGTTATVRLPIISDM